MGVSYRLGSATLRASFNRFFQPPQTEYLLLSSSPEAQALSPFVDELGTGGADIHAERQNAFEVGAEVWLGRAVRADVAVWRRWIRNQGDPNVFFGTTVIFPNAVDRGEARGLDLRLEMLRRKGVSGFLTYTLAKIDQYGPINGGLFLEDDVIEIGPGNEVHARPRPAARRDRASSATKTSASASASPWPAATAAARRSRWTKTISTSWPSGRERTSWTSRRDA